MVDNEVRIDILRQVENGELSPDKASELLKHLEMLESPQEPDRHEEGVDVFPSKPETNRVEETPYFDEGEIKKPAWAIVFWLIPMFFGALVTVSSTSWLYQSYLNTGLSFRFWVSWIPFLIGIGLIYIAFVLMQSRWLYINIKQPVGEKPARIFLGFPVPLQLISKFYFLFKGKLPNQVKGMDIEELLTAFEDSTSSSTPMIINVDDEDGTKVEIYFG